MRESSLTVPPSGGARTDLRDSTPLGLLGRRKDIAYELRAGREHIWIVARSGDLDIVALRSGVGAAIQGQPSLATVDDHWVCDWRTTMGALRLKVSLPKSADFTIRCTTSFLPSSDASCAPTRDLIGPQNSTGAVHTTQRGLRTGLFYASYESPNTASMLYLQNFSSLTDLFELTDSTPADTVGGTLEEGGFLPPLHPECVLPSSREFVISDAFLAVRPEVPAPSAIAAQYFDLLADIYLALERPPVTYHDWPERGQRTMRDLCLSPSCTYERDGHRYVMPYVGDTSKPPESMVQLTVLVNALEYERWRGFKGPLTAALLKGIDSFYDPACNSVVRWLPGQKFGEQSEENMDHESMDSWYLYHSLFNLSRLASLGDRTAREIVRKSLPFAIRVARRFDYRWPIFFNLKSLDVVRAESSPGHGGERDVAGLYALVMLHAHELFGEPEYLEEATRAAAAMAGLAFRLGYQTNTTGFAAEAMLRLWLITKERFYLEMSELCLANIFDNMWLWECKYGRARHYTTFFGLFPLREAPYLAAYEEMETQAKFHDYLSLGGNDVRPSIRLLLAEYQKYSLDRGWFYYPDALPVDALAEKSRNGKIERALSVPIEDLQDGRIRSGEVGQELYGSGLAFVRTSRHYAICTAANCLIYCTYPKYEYVAKPRGNTIAVTFKVGGDRRAGCELRIIPLNSEVPVPAVVVKKKGQTSNLKGHITIEGHQAYQLTGDTAYELRLARATKEPARSKRASRR